MRLFFKLSLFLPLIWCAAAQSASAVPSSGDDVLKLDRSFAGDLNKANQTALSQVIDPDFSWTSRTGKTVSKPMFLSSLASFGTGDDAGLRTMDAGSVVLLYGTHHLIADNVNVRFLRIWVKRTSGWQLLIYQETNKADKNPEKRAGFGAPSNGGPVVCDNPCETIPYKPDTPAEAEVASMWQAVERTVLTNDVEAWIPNFTDDFLFVTPDGGTPLDKADRVAMIKELRRTNTTLIPAEVLSMKVWVFGDAAVMRSEHKPRHGKILHVTRLFEKHDGHWQIAFGQQTWVE